MKLEQIRQKISGRFIYLGFGSLAGGALLILAGLSAESLVLFLLGGILVIAFAVILLMYLSEG